ncbi:MAG: hypothetical protein JWP36_1365 [Paucimonas sp.]|nr:hypothetical protein [Paucimonas sp.]
MKRAHESYNPEHPAEWTFVTRRGHPAELAPAPAADTAPSVFTAVPDELFKRILLGLLEVGDEHGATDALATACKLRLVSRGWQSLLDAWMKSAEAPCVVWDEAGHLVQEKMTERMGAVTAMRYAVKITGCLDLDAVQSPWWPPNPAVVQKALAWPGWTRIKALYADSALVDGLAARTGNIDEVSLSIEPATERTVVELLALVARRGCRISIDLGLDRLGAGGVLRRELVQVLEGFICDGNWTGRLRLRANCYGAPRDFRGFRLEADFTGWQLELEPEIATLTGPKGKSLMVHEPGAIANWKTATVTKLELQPDNPAFERLAPVIYRGAALREFDYEEPGRQPLSMDKLERICRANPALEILSCRPTGLWLATAGQKGLVRVLEGLPRLRCLILNRASAALPDPDELAAAPSLAWFCDYLARTTSLREFGCALPPETTDAMVEELYRAAAANPSLESFQVVREDQPWWPAFFHWITEAPGRGVVELPGLDENAPSVWLNRGSGSAGAEEGRAQFRKLYSGAGAPAWSDDKDA